MSVSQMVVMVQMFLRGDTSSYVLITSKQTFFYRIKDDENIRCFQRLISLGHLFSGLCFHN